MDTGVVVAILGLFGIALTGLGALVVAKMEFKGKKIETDTKSEDDAFNRMKTVADKYEAVIEEQDKKINKLEENFETMKKEINKIKENHEIEINYYKDELDKKDDIIDGLEQEKQELVTQNQNYKQEIDTLKSRVDRLEKPDREEET